MKYIVMLYLFVVCFVQVTASDFSRSMDKSKKLIAKERWNSAISKLERLGNSKKISGRERGEITTLLSLAYEGKGEYDNAKKVLLKLITDRPASYHIRLGETYCALKEYRKAISESMVYVSNSDPDLRFNGMWIRARSELELKRYLNCMNSCKHIISGISKLYEGDLNDKLKEIAIKAKELYDKARDLYEKETYGMDYLWYRQAREKEFSGDYHKAIDYYGKIKGGTLKDAGKCYSAHCFVKLNEPKEALKLYEELYRDGINQLYAREALYYASVLLYSSSRGKQLTKAINLLRRFTDKKALMGKSSLEGINNALKRDIIATAPKNYLRPDDCGNLIRTKEYPGRITNRLTSPWYMPYMMTRVQLFYGFLLGESGEMKKAAQSFRHAGELSKTIKILSDKGTVPALLASLDGGNYLLPDSVYKKISSRNKISIKLACFFYLTEEKSVAKKILDKLASSKEVSSKSKDRAAVMLGQVYCLISSGKWEEAGEILSRLYSSSKYKSTSAGKQAVYLHACLLSSNRAEWKRACLLFERLQKEKKNEVGAKALLSFATSAVNNGKRDVAMNVCKTLLKVHGSSIYAKPAKTLLAGLKKNVNKNSLLTPFKSKSGSIKEHRRTIIYPGTSDWKVDESTLNEGDLIIYRIRCIARDDCSIIRSFRMDLSEDEPQVPCSLGNELLFLRIPILFVKNLTCDFKKFTEVQK